MNERRLATYLNDRHAILVGGAQLAARAAESNVKSPYGPLLKRIAADIESDRALLRSIMAAQGVSPDRIKSSLAWIGEKVGRLKPNDQITGYSPLSRVVELDGLTAIITLADSMWQALDELLPDDLAAPRDRARRNLDELAALRPRALREAVVD